MQYFLIRNNAICKVLQVCYLQGRTQKCEVTIWSLDHLAVKQKHWKSLGQSHHQSKTVWKSFLRDTPGSLMPRAPGSTQNPTRALRMPSRLNSWHMSALPNLLRGVLQADELPIHVYLLDGHVPRGRGRVGNGHAAAGFRLLHIDPLPLAAGRADAAAGWGARDGHPGGGAGGQLQPGVGKGENTHTSHHGEGGSGKGPPCSPQLPGRRVKRAGSQTLLAGNVGQWEDTA